MIHRWLTVGVLLTALFNTFVFAEWPHTGKYGYGTRFINVYNELDRDIWVFFRADDGRFNDSLFLRAQTQTLYELPNRWNAGQCYATYDQRLQKPFVTLAEWTLGAPDSRADFYDISLVDAFSVPMLLGPVEGTYTRRENLPIAEQKYDCGTAICSTNVLLQCPEYLQWRNDAGELVSCLGSCQAAARGRVDGSLRTWYCCEAEHNVPETCPTNPIATWFKELNPDAYSYAYDDHKSTYVCVLNPDNGIGPDYNLVFGSQIPGRTRTLNTQIAKATNSVLLSLEKNNAVYYDLIGHSARGVSFSVYACSGKLVMKRGLNEVRGTVALGALPRGAYVVSLSSDRVLRSERIVLHN